MERFYQGNFYLAIERTFCKGCALCVNSCPTGILYLDGKSKISIKDINKCVFCGLCEARCPDFAIWIVKDGSQVHKCASPQEIKESQLFL